MSVRAFLVGLTLGCVASVTPGCGMTTKRCLRSNCAGCCDANDECQTGVAPFACGSDGRSCSTCGAGQTCANGVCAGFTGGGAGGGATGGGAGGGATAGGAGGGMALCANCNGCCTSTGTCRGGNTLTECGNRGSACQNCQAMGKACSVMGACIEFRCPGCVIPDGGGCVMGNTNLACGSDAGICQQCGAAQSCFGGQCVTATTCGPANCNGCCDGTMCVQAPTQMRCGSSGNMCRACGASEQCIGGTCTGATAGGAAGGAAGGGTGGGAGTGGGGVNPLGCSTITCAAGCCDSSMVCQPGTSVQACGVLGATCRPCNIACTPFGCI